MNKWRLAISVGLLLLVISLWELLNTNLGLIVFGLFNKPHQIVLADQLLAEWMSVKATNDILDKGKSLSSYDSTIFFSSKSISDYAHCYNGLILKPQNGLLKQTNITILSFDTQPEVGCLRGMATMQVTAPNSSWAFTIKVDVLAKYVGIQNLGPASTPVAVFRWFPQAITPVFNLLPNNLLWNGTDSTILAETVHFLTHKNPLTFYVPVQYPLNKRLGMQQKESTKFGDSSITWKGSISDYTVDLGQANYAPIFTSYGIWIVGKIEPNGQDSFSSHFFPSSSASSDLRKEINDLQVKMQPALAAINPGNTDFRICLNSSLFSQLLNAIKVAPEEARTFSFKLDSHVGNLAEKNWHDDILGSIEASANIASDNDSRAFIHFTATDPSWSKDGLSFSVPANAHVEAPINLSLKLDGLGSLIHADFHTPIKLFGDTSGLFSVHLKSLVLKRADGKYPVATFIGSVDPLPIPVFIRTDGTLKIDAGGLRVPYVGIIMDAPLINNMLQPLPVLDTSPFLFNITPPDTNEMEFGDDLPFFEVTATPESFNSSTDGYVLDATINLTHLPFPGTPNGWKSAQASIARDQDAVHSESESIFRDGLSTELSSQSSQYKIDPPSLVINGIDIGSTNDVVKCISNAISDITVGPSSSNELVKAGVYIGFVLRNAPGGDAFHSFLVSSDSASKAAFGDNSAAYAAYSKIDNEVLKVQQNPAKAVLDIPSNLINTCGDLPGQAQILISDSNPHVQFDPVKGVSVGSGSVEFTLGINETKVVLGNLTVIDLRAPVLPNSGDVINDLTHPHVPNSGDLIKDLTPHPQVPNSGDLIKDLTPHPQVPNSGDLIKNL